MIGSRLAIAYGYWAHRHRWWRAAWVGAKGMIAMSVMVMALAGCAGTPIVIDAPRSGVVRLDGHQIHAEPVVPGPGPHVLEIVTVGCAPMTSRWTGAGTPAWINGEQPVNDWRRWGVLTYGCVTTN